MKSVDFGGAKKCQGAKMSISSGRGDNAQCQDAQCQSAQCRNARQSRYDHACLEGGVTAGDQSIRGGE